ncbi:hypothetical protein DFJ74DRAFT_770679 [Hyaloraphidium curvatum]|nr:hypothetical protein DFJ74DRAFT_770679 [Hyaloraphidium curvatum]
MPSMAATPQTLTAALWAHVKGRHRRSNNLVNLKLVGALSSRSVYAQLVRDFYEVFRTFESLWDQELRDSKERDSGRLLRGAGEALALFGRTKAFERDLHYYYGSDWETVSKPTPTALAYCDHIKDVAKQDPDLLLCFIYAFYSGLMAGGWVLRRKIIRVVWRLPSEIDWDKRSGGSGTSIFEFSLPSAPRELAEIHLVRTQLKAILDAVPWREAGPDKLQKMKEELVRVFEWNDMVISNVPGGLYEFVMAWIWWIVGLVLLIFLWLMFR